MRVLVRMTKLTFDDLRQANLRRIPLFKNSKGQLAHPPDKSPTGPGSDWPLDAWMNACAGELGEAANVIKKVRRGDFTLEQVREDLGKELADIACYLDIVAMQAGIDLGDAVVQKFNEVSARIGVDVMLVPSSGAAGLKRREPEIVARSEVSKHVVMYSDGGWYFYDECSQEHGPFTSHQVAIDELEGYCKWLEHGPTSQVPVGYVPRPGDRGTCRGIGEPPALCSGDEGTCRRNPSSKYPVELFGTASRRFEVFRNVQDNDLWVDLHAADDYKQDTFTFGYFCDNFVVEKH